MSLLTFMDLTPAAHRTKRHVFLRRLRRGDRQGSEVQLQILIDVLAVLIPAVLLGLAVLLATLAHEVLIPDIPRLEAISEKRPRRRRPPIAHNPQPVPRLAVHPKRSPSRRAAPHQPSRALDHRVAHTRPIGPVLPARGKPMIPKHAHAVGL